MGFIGYAVLKGAGHKYPEYVCMTDAKEASSVGGGVSLFLSSPEGDTVLSTYTLFSNPKIAWISDCEMVVNPEGRCMLFVALKSTEDTASLYQYIAIYSPRYFILDSIKRSVYPR